MTKLIAAHQAKMGDVVYLHPEHSKYEVEGIGIVISTTTKWVKAGSFELPSNDVVPLFIATEKAIKRIDDSERCIEVVSKQLLADVTGYTRRQVDEWVAEAKQGKLDKAFMTLMQEPAEPWQPEKPAYEAEHESDEPHQSEHGTGAPFDEALPHADATDKPAF